MTSTVLIIIMFLTSVYSQKAKANSGIDSECDDFDFMRIVPFKEIVSTVQNAVRSDGEIQSLGSYLNSPEFGSLFRNVLEIASARRLLQFVNGIGLNVGQVVDKVGQQLLSTSSSTSVDSDGKTTRAIPPGISGLTQHVISMMPAQKILRCLNFRVNTDPVFKTIIDGFNSPEFHNLIEHVRSSEQFTTLQSTLKDRGLEINGLINQGLNLLRVPPG